MELERMVKEGASLNEVDEKEKFTPLHWAAYLGALEALILFIASDSTNLSPL